MGLGFFFVLKLPDTICPSTLRYISEKGKEEGDAGSRFLHLILVSIVKFSLQISKGRGSHVVADCYSAIRPLYTVLEISLTIETYNRTNNVCLLFSILMSGNDHLH